MTSRILRSYVRVAQQEHWCERCQSPITAGEMYRGEVYVQKNVVNEKKVSWLTVRKNHSYIQDCHDWELDLEIFQAEDARRTIEEQQKQSLTLLTLLAQARTRRI
ncbi:MAG: hypothetical protein AABW71_02810 [Nanoarchaeota archaeon]